MTMTRNMHDSQSFIQNLRAFLLTIFLFGSLSTGVELLLLGHTEDSWQWVPLVLIGCSMLVLLCYAFLRHGILLRALQMLMLLFIMSGIAGIVLHYQAKVEFKLEMQPDLSGWQLFAEVMQGATLPPVLAAGMMAQLGLLGLAYCYRHPKLLDATKQNSI